MQQAKLADDVHALRSLVQGIAHRLGVTDEVIEGPVGSPTIPSEGAQYGGYPRWYKC